jgi:hypothetical protein
MKTIILIKLLIIASALSILAQPYLYYRSSYYDTSESKYLDYISRLNVVTNLSEDYPPDMTVANYVDYAVDPSGSYLAVFINNTGSYIYSCSDTSVYYELDDLFGAQFDEILYSQQRNKLFIFWEDWSQNLPYKLSVFDLGSGQITQTIGITDFEDNSLMQPGRSSFFSSDQSKIYFYSIDTLTRDDQVWTYSMDNNTVTQKKDLSELGYQNAGSYSLEFGRNGKGIITSYFNNGNDCYYRVYNFDADTGSTFIHTANGSSEAYFTCDGEFLLIMDTNFDSSRFYYHTGTGRIYEVQNNEQIKSFTVPSRGKTYTFDNYPNNIYYALNLDSLPQVYNLTQLKLHSISPPLALPYNVTPAEPNVLTITVTGEFFTDSTVAYYNGYPKTTTYVSDSVVTLSLSSLDFRFTGNYPVWVTNYGSVSDTLYFSVVNTLPESITPILECVRDNHDHTYTAFWGYNNQNDVSVAILPLKTNIFSPGATDIGQPKIFLPGRQDSVFSVNFDGHDLTWSLYDTTVTANKNSPPCQ